MLVINIQVINILVIDILVINILVINTLVTVACRVPISVLVDYNTLVI